MRLEGKNNMMKLLKKLKNWSREKTHHAFDGIGVMQRQGITTIGSNLTFNDGPEKRFNTMKDVA